MSFAFNFSGDDIEGSDDGASEAAERVNDLSLDPGTKRQESEQVRLLSLDELLAALPSSIAYTSTHLDSPQHKHHAIIPRRALFDVRMQLMAESEDIEDHNQHEAGNISSQEERKQLSGLGESDIEQNVYEGGFKSWEGAMDLALLLLDEYGSGEDFTAAEEEGFDHVIELGCGTGLPSLTYLYTHLARLGKDEHHTPPDDTNTDPTTASNGASTPTKPSHLHLTLADYNASVIRLVTLPNILLTWALFHAPEAFSPAPPSLANHTRSTIAVNNLEGDLEITPHLLEAFKSSLTTLAISLSFTAGPWSASLTSLILDSIPAPSPSHSHSSQKTAAAGSRSGSNSPRNSPRNGNEISTLAKGRRATLVLAAETIYNPTTTPAFTSCLLSLLRHCNTSAQLGGCDCDTTAQPPPTQPRTKALIAAKTLYFGVGGSVADFTRRVEDVGAKVRTVAGTGGVAGAESEIESRGGVKRWVGEVVV